MNRINSRLAARRGISQVETLLKADAAAALCDRAVIDAWRALLALLRSGRKPAETRRAVRAILDGTGPALQAAMSDGLGRLARWAHKRAAADLAKTLPVDYLRVAAHDYIEARRGVGASLPGAVSDAAVAEHAAGVVPALLSVRGVPVHQLTEDAPAPSLPGLVRLATGENFKIEDLLGPYIRNEAEARAALSALLFPAPDAATVVGMLSQLRLDGQSIRQRLAGATLRFNPDRIADTFAASYAQGKSQREIAKDLLPAFNGLRVSAARTARTYGLAVAGEINRRVDDQLGDLSVGVQVHATLDQWTRTNPDFLKNHRARDGTIFHKHPGPGEYGLDKAPKPPLEYDGEVAWNCRCYTSPVLRAPVWAENQEKLKLFTDARERLIPDPAVYADWFASADERRRRLAVGARRYVEAEKKLGRRPEYADFVDAHNGQPLSVEALKRESPEAHAERTAKVRAEIEARRADVEQVSTFGWVRDRKAAVPGVNVAA